MTPENTIALEAHLQAIAAILYEGTPPATRVIEHFRRN